MPKSKEYISSESEEHLSGSEEETKKKTKKDKPKKRDSSSESEEDTKSKKRTKKDKSEKPPSKKTKKDDDEPPSWDLGNNRQVNIGTFKNQLLVSIREMYYDKSGELRPGKKGISLNMKQWHKFMSVVEEVDKAVKEKC